tara:strand:- start:93 stop:833 length:741 start_codon:yes stop_codon:yes gene_type:complete
MDRTAQNRIFNCWYILALLVSAYFLSLDFYSFLNVKKDIKISSYNLLNTEIYGNHFLPNVEVLKKINKDIGYENDYDYLIETFKTVQISENNSLVIINENEPLFCDYNNIYFSGDKSLHIDKDIANKQDLVFIDIYSKNKSDYKTGLKRMESFISYLKNKQNEIHEILERIEIDEDSFLSIYLKGCKVKMFKIHHTYSNINLNKMKKKISVFSLFLKNEEINIESLEEINLSMEDDGLIIWQERLN